MTRPTTIAITSMVTRHQRFVFLLLAVTASSLAVRYDQRFDQTANANEDEVRLPSSGRRSQTSYNIGAVLSSNHHIHEFTQAIQDTQSSRSVGPKLEAVTMPMNINPIRTAQSVCDQLISAQVLAVIVSHPTGGDVSPASVSFTCGFYDIPVIGISNRDSSLSNKNLHASFMRTIAPFSHQADVWIEILKQLKYHTIVFIHSSDSDGRTTLNRFQNLADAANIKVETVIEYEPGLTDIVEKLDQARQQQCRVFIINANVDDAESIFREVKLLNMSDEGFVWLVSEQALQAPSRPDGLIGLRLTATDELSMIRDSVNVLYNAFVRLYNDSWSRPGPRITPPPSDCSKLTSQKWETGIRLLSYLKNETLNGLTGRLAFDERGDRLLSDYNIVNVVQGKESVVGNFTFSKINMVMQLRVDVSEIIWPGNSRKKPIGIIVPTHLHVVTIAEKPFVWKKPVDVNRGDCSDRQIRCPKRINGTDNEFCCEGYCIDLLAELARRLNFTFELELVADGQYGALDFADGWDQPRRWTGLVGDLVFKQADMAVAPLTINPERGQVIDFSKPFKYQSITILQKKRPQKAALASILQPFRGWLWILLLISIHVVTLALYLLDRFSPFGGYPVDNAPPNDDNNFSLSSSLWFSWAILLNSGIGERTPRSFSARVLGMVWAGFGMIVVASYTANLAASLVLNPREDYTISGIEDARLRNPIDSFSFATVKASAVDMFFRRQVELANAYRKMEETNKESVEEAIKALRDESLDAFIWDSPRLEYEAAKDCELVTTGEPFGRSGYGIGFQKNSFWTEQVTLELLLMHESGYMESLDNKWILSTSQECDAMDQHFPYTLGMKNMAGIFVMVFAGIVVGFGLIVIEIVYKKRRARKLRRLAIAKQIAIRWRMRVEKKRLLYSQLQPPRLSLHKSEMKSQPFQTSQQSPVQAFGLPPTDQEKLLISAVKTPTTMMKQSPTLYRRFPPMHCPSGVLPVVSFPRPTVGGCVNITSRDLAKTIASDCSRSSTPLSDDFSTPFVIPPPPPPPTVGQRSANTASGQRPASMTSLHQVGKRSAQQKIYEFKHRYD